MIVVDTSVVIAGLRSPRGASAEVLRRVLSGKIDATTSTALILEYEAVATRPEHLRTAGLDQTQMLAVIDALATIMKSTPIRWRLRPLSPDPDDDFVLEAAFNASAGVVATNNPADFERPGQQVGIRAVTLHMLLMELEP